MNELISVIIPVYNGEKHISRMIKSVLLQTYKNFELLIINDGSKDDTVKEVSKFADDRIKLFDKENTGVSDTRNYGLAKSSGKYVAFLDADDTISEEYLEKLYHKIKEDDSDITLCEYNRVLEGKIINSKSLENIKCLDDLKQKEEYISMLLSDDYKHKNVWGVVWRTLFKKEIINNIYFDKNISISEDMVFLIEALLISKRVSVIKDSLYNYYIYDQSVLGKDRKKYDDNLFEKRKYYFNTISNLLKKLNVYDDLEYTLKLAKFNNYLEILNKTFVIEKHKRKYFILNCKKIREDMGKAYKKFKISKKKKVIYFFIRNKLYFFLFMIYISKKNLNSLFCCKR